MAWANLRAELEEEFEALSGYDADAADRLREVKDLGLAIHSPKYTLKGREPARGRDPEKRRAWWASPAGKASDRKYNQSAKGRAAARKYERSEKGRASGAARRARYRKTEKYKAAQRMQKRRWRAKKRAEAQKAAG